MDPAGFGLKGILITAEPFSPEWATRMQEVWATTFHEIHGSTVLLTCASFTSEAGAVPGGKRGFMHVLEHLLHSDVVNPKTGELAEDGEAGELIVTSLERQAMPILRFQTGERVTHLSYRNDPSGRPFDGWACGEVMRFDDMVGIGDSEIWPCEVDPVIFARDEISEYQAEVLETGGGTAVVMKVEFDPGSPPHAKDAVLSGLADELDRTTGIRMRIEEADEELPRFELKPRRWTDRRSEGVVALSGNKEAQAHE